MLDNMEGCHQIIALTMRQRIDTVTHINPQVGKMLRQPLLWFDARYTSRFRFDSGQKPSGATAKIKDSATGNRTRKKCMATLIVCGAIP